MSTVLTQPGLQRRLARELKGSASFDPFTRGRYATDASIYQIMPVGVVFPRDAEDIRATLAIAGEHGTPVIMRGAGTSQNGQPIGAGLVLDCSRHLNETLDYDPEGRRVRVQPGVVLGLLNARLRRDGLFFPVEPSTASRCTLGGMAGNNSSGARSIRYGKMVDNVSEIEAVLADGTTVRFGRSAALGHSLPDRMVRLALREQDEIAARYPAVQRRVGGYNLDALLAPEPNLAHLLVGSEGTLAAFTSITLPLQPVPKHAVMGVCHFPTFQSAMECTRHIVELSPVAVELVDSNILTLGAEIPLFRSTLERITRGRPDCLLLVEFSGDALDPLLSNLSALEDCLADRGFPDAVVAITEPAAQRAVWDMREACLNIMMSMKGDAKPVSFIEDCAVPLEHLATYTAAVTDLFARHGTRGTWYAHASVGCLHVRPILDMKSDDDIRTMRRIAEAASALVRDLKGSFSGEHGDGISRSEFIEPMFGERLTRCFEEVKDAFDPRGLLNPGKIVRPYRMDDRRLMRFGPGYRPARINTALDWSDWGGFSQAVEMCNNNGACRALGAGVMCPSYRVTRDEEHVTRGRANTLRLALSGQLGPDALTSPAMRDSLALCVGCKACKRECPTGVDMARMKAEALHASHSGHGVPIRQRIFAHLPRYAPLAARLRGLANLRDELPGAPWLSEKLFGLSRRRRLPAWRRAWQDPTSRLRGDGRDLVLFGDTFNRYFEPDNLEAAARVLERFGYRPIAAPAPNPNRPLCCGRTFFSAGLIAEARREAEATVHGLRPLLAQGARVIVLEPACLSMIRDDYAALLPGATAQLLSSATMALEELLTKDGSVSGVTWRSGHAEPSRAHIHGHCHQKSLGLMSAMSGAVALVPGVTATPIESGCCGMAGSFGYEAEHVDVSLRMGELSLFPAVRAADLDDVIIANGASCRHQIKDGTGRDAVHLARLLDRSLH